MLATPPELMKLKNKITSCTEFTLEERSMILAALMLDEHPSGAHKYPGGFGPKDSRWAKETWDILDNLKPETLTLRERYMIGGMIAGALSRMYEHGRRGR